jgi:DNA-binding HxlR family transcriptional regulator/putative sterol carrier protein
MAMKRTYEDACRFAHALDLVGERWALLVVRELILGPKRFTDLRAGLPHASPNVLAQRLRELEEAGVIRRRRLAPPAASKVYELTEWGQELEPVVTQLGHWGARAPTPPRAKRTGPDAIVLALRAHFDPERIRGVSTAYELRLGEDRYTIGLADGRLDLARGGADQPDTVIESDTPTFAQLISGERTPAEALRAGDVKIDGGRQALERFLGYFPMPEPAATTAG